jgi:hypothetical protein
MREELLLRDKEVEVFTEIETERDDLAKLVDQLSKELRSVREQSTDAARRAREAEDRARDTAADRDALRAQLELANNQRREAEEERVSE